ncbi:MAG: hypothetical protein CTY12_02160 [Methylotenera sp.]|nr:MAG: hypothetical protein CTY12_02160 [Methylotenera sp.]
MKRGLLDLVAQSRGVFDSEDKDKDVRIALKLPARSNSKNREISKAFSKMQSVLRSSKSSGGSGRSGARSKFQKGVGTTRRSVSAPNLQRVAVRFSFSNAKTAGQWAAHGKYLERESAQGEELEAGQKQEPTLGFGSDGDDIPLSKTLGEWQKSGDEHMFKMIVSPEFGDKLDLKRAVTEQMQVMEKDLGTRLEWVAVAHYNTDNPHVHIAVRGRDDQGKSLEINPDYIKLGSRQRAQEAATRQLGYRTQIDVAEGLERQVSQQRFTDIDRQLVKQAKINVSQVTFDSVPPSSESARELRVLQIRRVTELEKMGLATRVGNMRWQLSPDLESALRQVQISQDRLKTKFQHREMVSDPQAPLVNTYLKKGERVAGKVVGTGLNEASNKPYILLEGVDGKLHFMSQSAKLEELRGSGKLKAGEFVEISVSEKGFQSVRNFGREMGPEFIDEQILSGKAIPEKLVSTQTVAGRFRLLVNERAEALAQANVLTKVGQKIEAVDLVKLDARNFTEKGLKLVAPKRETGQIYTVESKGRASFVAKDLKGQVVQLDKPSLEKMGLSPQYITEKTMIFISADDAKRPFATLLNPEKMKLTIEELKPNKLDLIVRQISEVPAGHPMKEVVNQRQEVWATRGVDLGAENFAMKAGGFKKSHDLHERAQKEGIAPVLNELSQSRNKSVVELDSKPGMQVTGRVVLVNKKPDQTEIVIDSGRELTLIRQPAGQEGPSLGQRIQARAQEINTQNNQQRLRLWRFADLDLQRTKSKEKGHSR